MTLHYIKQGLLLLLLGFWFPLLAPAQEISSLPPSTLPFGSYVTGLYHLEADDASGLYLEEQVNGTLIAGTLSTGASGFYFWLVENVYEDTFQLYSATQQEKLLVINTDGSIQWTTDPEAETSKLLFRMYPEGPQRTATDEGVVAIGYITTGKLTANYGNADCQCNFLKSGTNSRFRIHDSGIQGQNYRPVVFEKTNDANALGTVDIDTVNHVTRISQSPPPVGPSLPHNFVSSNFFVKGFGEDDFEITVSSGAEGFIGFLNYTDHHYTKAVYKNARSRIGIKIANNVISLVHLSGDQLLPSGSLGKEEVTNFVTGTPFTMGFKGQDSLVVSQNGTTYALERAAPAELFFNRSITQSARMLVQLVKDTVEVAYTTKNYLINSEDDLGTDDGSDLVSTHAFFPYNAGDLNLLVNTFDWQQTQWPVRYDDAGTVDDLVFSPFYSNSTEFSGISARYSLSGNYEGGEDFATSEGWELLKADLGYNADGTVRPQAPIHPHIMFYDRVSGTLRVFIYTNNQGEANQLTISLSAMHGTPPNGTPGYVPKLWGSLQQFESLDQVQQSEYSKALPFYSGAGRNWYFADFVMEYDPCIAFFESTINLQVYKTTQGDLTMIGRFEGGSLPAGTPEYSNWQNQREHFLMGVMDNSFGGLQNTLGDITFNQYEDFDLLEFRDTIGGLLVGKKIADWEKEKARIEWEANQTIGHATITEGSAKIVEGAASFFDSKIPLIGLPSKAIQASAKIAQGAAKVVSGKAKLRLAGAKKLYYDNIKDKVKRSDQQIQMAVPPPRPQLVFGELALQGTLTIQTTLIPEEFIAMPGGLNSGVGENDEWYKNNSRGSEPLYNRPMGKFTLLKQPQFGIGVIKSSTGAYGGAWLKIKEKPYFAHNNTALGKIDDMLSISIHVQTLDSIGSVVRSSTGEGGYSALFGTQGNNPLPGEIDISDLVDWEQINLNIAGLINPSEQDIEDQLANWIQVSYEVWSLTLTNLKARNLSRVFANGDQYYTGNSSFAYNGSSASIYRLTEEAKTLAGSEFPDHNFSDDVNFGNTYRFYHTDYDKAGDEFYTIMNNYCTALETAQNLGAKDVENTQDIKGEEAVEEAPVTEELTATQPGLTVYPNPVQHQLNFRLVSQEAGEARITLYDLMGRALISTTDYLDGHSTLQGLVNIGSLTAGIYILEVKLPDGKSLNKKIIKK